MLSEATLDVANIAEDFLKNFPRYDTSDRREVIESARSSPEDKALAHRLYIMTSIFFDTFPYAELDGDDEKMTNLRLHLFPQTKD